MTSATLPATDTFELYPHQQRGIEVLEHRNGRAGLFFEMRVGKTRTALAYLHNKAYRILVVCPLGTFGVWREEVSKLPPFSDYHIVALSDTIPVEARAKSLLKASKNHDKMLVLANFEAYWRTPLRQAILKWAPEAVVIDEAHKLRNRTSRQSKFAHVLAEHVKYAIPLTGTPIVRGPEDLYSIYRFMDPSVFGKSWAAFQQTFLIMGGFGGYQIVGRKNMGLMKSLVAGTACRVRRRDCFEEHIPKTLIPSVTLTEKSAEVYNAIRKDGLARIDGVDPQGNKITGTALSRIVLTTIGRLQQVTSGFCRTEDDVDIDLASEKLDTCTSIVDEAATEGESVVIFCRFLRDIARIENALRGMGISAGVLQGVVPQEERTRILARFRDKSIPVIICQIQVGSLSIDLSAASVAVFYSTGFALDDFEQARDRLQGVNQTKSVAYYFLVATLPNGKATIDEKVYRTLSSRKKLASEVLRDPIAARAMLSE